MNSRKNEYNNLKDSLKHCLDYRMEDYYARHFNHYTVLDFDYISGVLPIEYWSGVKFNNYFVKRNGDLVTREDSSYRDKDMLAMCGNEISSYYDRVLGFKDLFEQCEEKINSSNSKFNVDINKDEVAIVVGTKFGGNFRLSSQMNENDYKYSCSSNDVINVFRNREEEIFKRIFVEIDDCPLWMQSMLYELREKQVKKQISADKRLELKRKIFPFLKK